MADLLDLFGKAEVDGHGNLRRWAAYSNCASGVTGSVGADPVNAHGILAAERRAHDRDHVRHDLLDRLLAVLEEQHPEDDAIDLIVPHQASGPSIALGERYGLPPERTVSSNADAGTAYILRGY